MIKDLPNDNEQNEKTIFKDRRFGFLLFMIFILIAFSVIQFTRISSLQTKLDYVTSLAENADNYAHTHY